MLSRVLHDDKSVQRLPAIRLKNVDSKDKAYFTERSNANMHDSSSKVGFSIDAGKRLDFDAPEMFKRSGYHGAALDHLNDHGSLLEKSGSNLKDILRLSKARNRGRDSKNSSQIYTDSRTII